MVQKGVNLGGWLVLERWMTPSLFEGTDAKDEYGLSLAGETFRERIRQHHKTFITESDFRWLKQHDIQAVRIPVGYWLFGDEPPFVGGVEALDFAFTIAQKYDIKILLSIHGAAGSQNGKHHSGQAGKVRWHVFRHKNLDFTEKLAKRYGAAEALWGIELLNEPRITPLSFVRLIRYYSLAVARIRRHTSDSTRVVISGDVLPRSWSQVARNLGLTLDLHLYHSFGQRNRTRSAAVHIEKAARATMKLQQLNVPIIIGEWSAVLGNKATPKDTKPYIDAQLKSYEVTDAWFYWTYKTEQPGSWNYRSLYEEYFRGT